MAIEIRNFHPSDLYQLYKICLETGASGEDATGTIDPELLGHIYAAPYALADPSLCFVLVTDGWPMGYILGTADSLAFGHWLEENWWPGLRAKYPQQDLVDSRTKELIDEIRSDQVVNEAYYQEYPAHLHIDLLKPVQSEGYGSRLMDTFLRALADRQVPGVHLGVGKSNERAVAWYPKFGFEIVAEDKFEIIYGLKL